MRESIRAYLPSPKFQKIAGILLIVLLVGLLVSQIPKIIKTKEEVKPIPYATLGVGELVEDDADADGLKDWEEPLWGLDPENPDTDGNGVTDGEEILRIRNSIDTSTTLAGEEDVPLTQTGTFSQELFSLISALQENGELTDQSRASIEAEIVAFIQNGPEGTVYYKTDIKTVADTSANALVYIKAVDSAFAKYPIKAEDFVLFDTVITTPNTTTVNSGLKACLLYTSPSPRD